MELSFLASSHASGRTRPPCDCDIPGRRRSALSLCLVAGMFFCSVQFCNVEQVQMRLGRRSRPKRENLALEITGSHGSEVGNRREGKKIEGVVSESEHGPKLKTHTSFAPRSDNPIVFLDISVGRTLVGRVLIELRSDIVPKACENFRLMCIGKGKPPPQVGLSDSPGLTYRGSPIHRVVSDFGLQGGDVTRGDGSGKGSAFGDSFPDENFTLRHTGPGCLSCVTNGHDANLGQFFITTIAAPWLDAVRVVFGCVMGEASLAVLSRVEMLAGTPSGMPRDSTLITDCGQLYPYMKDQ